MLSWAVYSLLSAIFFAIKDILSKKYLKENTSPNQIMFEEFLVILLIVGVLFFPNIEFQTIIDYWPLFIAKAFFLATSGILYLKLMKKHEISQVSPLLNLSPIVLLIITSFFLAEAITQIQFIGILIIIISTYFIEVNFHHHEKNKSHMHHFIELSKKDRQFFTYTFFLLLTISMAAISDKMLLEKVNVYTNMYFTGLIIFLVYLFYYLIENKLKVTLEHIVKEPHTLLIAIFTFISNFLVLLAIAVPGALISLIIPLRRTSTLFASLFGGILFHEKHLKRKLIATTFMLIGVILIVGTTGIHIE